MDPLTLAIIEVAKTLGVSPITAGALIPLVIILANRAARLIPDTAIGPLKWLRVAASVIGLHVKDNSGVPAVLTPEGDVIRQAPQATTPEPIQGVLDLTDEMKINIFDRAYKAIQTQKES